MEKTEKRGTTSIELEITYGFSADGDESLESVCFGGRELPAELAKRLLIWMGRGAQAKQVDECWANAEPVGDDDAASDEARAS